MRIAIDIDQTILDMLIPLIGYYNDKHGTYHKPEDMKLFGLHHVWGCSEEESLKEIHNFYETEYFNQIKPISGAVEGVKELSEKHELFTITSRTIKYRDKTIGQLESYFPNKFTEVFFDNRELKDGTYQITRKIDICQKYQIDILIDDVVGNFTGPNSTKIKGILIDTIWNEGELPENIERVYGWKGILAAVDDIINL